ncbi:MAG: efflux RND transporter periplasmic adaptor subunit [Thermodesulfobacteriota bacterium]|nr:efflux RND transporter periplasmic adaptor subunit [Thermodesulfobacteriota bacterium]
MKVTCISGGTMKSAIKRVKFMILHAGRAVAVIMSVLILFAAGCGREEVQEKREVIRPVKIMTIRDTSALLSYGFPGTVRAARRAVKSFKVSGPLVALPVEEGQQVKKGDLIAQIQKRDFQNAVNEALARYREAEQQFRRYKELYAKKQVSKADFDRYRAARDVAKAQLEDAKNALRDASLRASFDGVISKRYVENFQKVMAKDPIVNLQDISRVEVLVDVPELIIAEIREESGTKKIMARFESIPGKEFPLEIKEYSTEADPATQTYQVVLIMDQPREANILPGMTATVTATSRRAEGKGRTDIFVPAIAVLVASGNPYVWGLDPKAGVVHRKEVKIGSLEGSGSIRILDGINPGDTIVVAGVAELEEGMKVQPWEKQREGK